MSAPLETGETEQVHPASPEVAATSNRARASTEANATTTHSPARQSADERIVDRGWGATLRLSYIRLTSAVASRIATAPQFAANGSARWRWTWGAGGSLLTAGAAFAKSRGWV